MATTVIDEFVTLFKSDTTSLKKGVKDSEESLKTVDKNLNKTSKSFKGAVKPFSDFILSARGALAGLVTFGTISAGIFSAIGRGKELSVLSDTLGENVTELDQWTKAARLAGASGDAFQASLKKIDIGRKTGDDGIIRSLQLATGGIDHVNTPILELVKKALDGYNRAVKGGNSGLISERRKELTSLGLPEELINAAGKGQIGGLLSDAKKGGLISRKDVNDLREFRKEITATSLKVDQLFNKLAPKVLNSPLVKGSIKGLTEFFDYLIKDQDRIDTALTVITAGLTAMALSLLGVSAPLAAVAALSAAALATSTPIADDIKQNPLKYHQVGDVKDLKKQLQDFYPSVYSTFFGSSKKSIDNSAPNVNVTINGADLSNPAKVKQAAKEGTTQALNQTNARISTGVKG